MLFAMVCRSFHVSSWELLSPTIICGWNLSNSASVSEAIEQGLDHPGAIPCWNNNAQFYRHDVNPIEPGVITNFFRVKNTTRQVCFRVVPRNEMTNRAEFVK